jgi:hypothetical protein
LYDILATGEPIMLRKHEEVWPNFFIVGAQKAGTTSLHYYLKNIPGVYMPSMKEASYFAPNARQIDSFDIIRDKEEYLRLFKNAKGYVAAGDTSPIYLWDSDSPGLIHQSVPHARIIIILRDPVERAYSNFLMVMKYSGKKLDFFDELMRDYYTPNKRFDGKSQLYVELGMYYEQVKRYFDEFGRDRVKVIIFEEFIRHPEQSVNEVLAFLGVDYTISKVTEQYNPYSIPRSPLSRWIFSFFRWLRARNIKFYKILALLPDSITESFLEKFLFRRAEKPKIDDKAVKFLKEIYYADAIRLQSFLGRSLPWHTVLGDDNNNKNTR